WRFDDAQRRGVTPGRCADVADVLLREHAAATAVAEARDRLGQLLGQPLRPGADPLHQVERDPLRRLPADAGHAAQSLDQADEKRREGHAARTVASTREAG